MYMDNYRTFISKSYVILSIRYIPRNSIGFINRIPRYITDRLLYTMNSIGFTYRIPKYITDRQNYIGFTYNLPIFIYSECSDKILENDKTGCNTKIKSNHSVKSYGHLEVWA